MIKDAMILSLNGNSGIELPKEESNQDFVLNPEELLSIEKGSLNQDLQTFRKNVASTTQLFKSYNEKVELTPQIVFIKKNDISHEQWDDLHEQFVHESKEITKEANRILTKLDNIKSRDYEIQSSTEDGFTFNHAQGYNIIYNEIIRYTKDD